MNKPTIEDRVKEVIVNELGIEEKDYSLDSELVEDFGADSLDLVETVMMLEDEFKIEVTDEECNDVKTVKDVIALIKEKTADETNS